MSSSLTLNEISFSTKNNHRKRWCIIKNTVFLPNIINAHKSSFHSHSNYCSYILNQLKLSEVRISDDNFGGKLVAKLKQQIAKAVCCFFI